MFGESEELAVERLFSTERKLLRDNELKDENVEFMHEYESLSQITKTNNPNVINEIYPFHK